MENIQLRQLIKESIQEYIREVEASGNIAAQEAKIRACEEAIALREKKANMEGLDEAYHDMMDSTKINELKKEIKELQKYKAKAEKVLDKMKTKAEGKMSAKSTEDEGMMDEVIDEVTIDPPAGAQLEEDSLNEEQVLHMQKLAGIISETEYKAKVEEAKKKMTAAQKEKKEDIVKGMKKSKSFGKSKDEKSKMYATATKLATKKNKSLKEEVQALFEDDLNEVDESILGGIAKNLYLYLSKMKPNNPLDINGSPLKNVKGDPITSNKKVTMTYQNPELGKKGLAKDLGTIAQGGVIQSRPEVTINYYSNIIFVGGFVKKEEAEAALKYILDKYPNQLKGLRGEPKVVANKMDYEWAKNYAPKYSFELALKDDKEIAKTQSAKPTA
jgi:hypothetical protein